MKAFLKVGGILVLVVGAFAAGLSIRRSPPPPPTEKPSRAEEKVESWTCSMHPQIRLPRPGKCPICFMDLIPVRSDATESVGPRTFVTSEAAKALMDIQTSPVERRFVSAEVRMVGKVDYDETRVSHITSWLPGRLDRLYVDYTGVPVRKGDHMVYLYSPELLSAQEELLQAARTVRDLKASESGIIRESAQATLGATRDKLRLWGLTEKQVQEIETRGKPSDHMTIYAPAGGIVVSKDAVQGMYVMTGMRIYTIADLSQVWVKLDAYESDLVWLRYGQKVAFTPESYPGESFPGRIAFIDPVLDEKTRTVKVRVNVDNSHGKLKPGMFIRAVVRASVATGGKVMDPDLAGKWMCPMHPEQVKDAAGACGVCGMPLVRTESLGYVAVSEDDREKPLVIPASAPLVTGKRAVAYVEVPGAKSPTYEGREVLLGPRAGDFYIVLDGLREGDRVVTNGNFKIDSALQIMAKPSMMSPGGRAQTADAPPAPPSTPSAKSATPKPETPDAFRKQLGAVWTHYQAVGAALAKDDLEAARKAIGLVRDALKAVDMSLLAGDAHVAWMRHLSDLNKALDAADRAADIGAVRAAFALLSESFAAVVRAFGLDPGETVYVLRCPMAFQNRGANWLQRAKEAANPYFGAAMLTCGEVVEQIAPEKAAAEGGPHERH